MASIIERKRKRGMTFMAFVQLKGFPRKTASFDRKSDAMRWAEDVEHALLNNLPLPGEELPKDDKLIKDAVALYLDLMEKDLKRSRHTILTDRVTGKRLIDRFGRQSLRALAREDIEAYKAHRLREVGPSSIRQDMSMLSRIYETARIEWRMSGLVYPGQDVKLPAPPANRKTILADFQFAPLLEECKKSKNGMLYPLVSLLLGTGMRPEEAVTLRWRQVFMQEGIINLTKTKTDPRRVPLPEDCREILREMKGKSEENDLVFIDEETAHGDKPTRYFRRSFEQACIRAKINMPSKRDVSKKEAESITDSDDAARVTLYTLRHSAATYLIMCGVDIRSVADILGHSNITQTMRYTHVVDEHKRKAVNNENLPWKRK